MVCHYILIYSFFSINNHNTYIEGRKMDPIYKAYQKVNEANIRYNGKQPTIKLKKRITIDVEADIKPSSYIDTETGETVTEYASADIDYKTDMMEDQIVKALLPEIEKLVGYKIPKISGRQLIGFPKSISNAAFNSGKWR